MLITHSPNPIRSDIDLDLNGKYSGFLRLPHSVHRSAYGWVPIPVVSIRNGEGPVFLVSAGNHGDEYEGQIIASRLAREVETHMVCGQIIVLSMLNFPAAEAGLRTSPIDDGNLNRLFPGNPHGSPTQVIAHYIESELLARADYLVDLHSGGSSLMYDGANIVAAEPRDAEEYERVSVLLHAFGLQRAFLTELEPFYISAAARRQGTLCFLTELGGGGTVTPDLVRQGYSGLLHLLGHVGVLHGPLVPSEPPTVPRMLSIKNDIHHVYALHSGIWEPLVPLGSMARAGESAALIHFPDDPLRPPVTVLFPHDGEVVCKRVFAQVKRGDCLFQMAGKR